MIVEFSTVNNPTEHHKIVVSEILIDNNNHTFYIDEDHLELAPGIFVQFDGGAKGLELVVPNDQLEDLSWRTHE